MYKNLFLAAPNDPMHFFEKISSFKSFFCFYFIVESKSKVIALLNNTNTNKFCLKPTSIDSDGILEKSLALLSILLLSAEAKPKSSTTTKNNSDS